jgi:hypothetical protein
VPSKSHTCKRSHRTFFDDDFELDESPPSLRFGLVSLVSDDSMSTEFDWLSFFFDFFDDDDFFELLLECREPDDLLVLVLVDDVVVLAKLDDEDDVADEVAVVAVELSLGDELVVEDFVVDFDPFVPMLCVYTSCSCLAEICSKECNSDFKKIISFDGTKRFKFKVTLCSGQRL